MTSVAPFEDTAHLKYGLSARSFSKVYVPVLSFRMVISLNTGSIPDEHPAIRLIVPVGATVKRVMFLRGTDSFLHSSGIPNS